MQTWGGIRFFPTNARCQITSSAPVHAGKQRALVGSLVPNSIPKKNQTHRG